MAVISPSAHLLERLQIILANQGISAINLFFYTFSALAREIVEFEGSLAKPVLSDPLFFDTLVKMIQKEDRPFEGFQDLAIPDGFPGAVRATLRDLVDAGVPWEAQEAIKENFLGEGVGVGTLKQLFRLYQIYLEKIDRLPVLPRNALIKEATRLAPASSGLAQFKELIFYGFYDLTGIQLEFFQAAVKNHPSSLLFPYMAENPAFKFSGYFKDNFLQSAIHEEIRLPDGETGGKNELKIFNVSGLRDEAWIVAQEITRLHEENKIPFHEMAVVSRQKERLQNDMPEILGERKIPFNPVAATSLSEIPLAAMALQFLERGKLKEEERAEKFTWSGFVEIAIEALEEEFIPAVPEIGEIWDLMKAGLESLAKFDSLKPEISANEFLETLRDRWSETELPVITGQVPGVALLYAEQARGLSFRVVFVVGVEERVFPRIISEDPFLRDNARLALTNTLGYKIPQKMMALDEERLLFHLLVTSAREKIYLTYQRSDDEGAVVGPSSFLRSLVEERGLEFSKAVQTIPRSYFAKLEENLPEFQGMRDILIGELISGNESATLELAKGLGRDSAELKRDLTMQRSLQSFKEPGIFDGLVGKKGVDGFLKGRALSPSRLEIFGVCPFQYLATQIWGLEKSRNEVSLDDIDPREKGKLVHKFLEKFFRELTKGRRKKGPIKFNEPLAAKIFDSVISAVSAGDLKLPPILWESIRLKLWAEIKRCLQIDIEVLNAAGLMPTFFEKKVEAELDAPLDGGSWLGVMDRIDLGEGKGRIVDYKTGREKDLSVATGALQGRQSQPPLYLLLFRKLMEKEGLNIKDASFSYFYLKSEEPFREFSSLDWDKYKTEILHTVKTQVDCLRWGGFPILPGEYCDWCEVAQICRKNDGISAYRSEFGPAEVLETLREKKAARNK